MIANAGYRGIIGRSCGAGAHAPAMRRPWPGRSATAATTLLAALVLQCADVRADLLFRHAGQQGSALKRYANPADTAYPRIRADGSQVAAEEVQVFLHGYVTRDDVYGARVMESLVQRGRHRIAGNIVSLAGNGGDVDAAMEVGRVLRRLGVSTLVARDSQCLSSCVFAFMGGDRRTVAGRIGIHRPYFSSTRNVPDRRAHYRQLQKRLQDYIEELDFPSSLYEAVMAVPPESISILTAADLKKFYLQGMSPPAEDEADAAAARALGIPVLEYLQQKAQAQPCSGEFGGDGACEAKATAAGGAAAAVPRGAAVDESAPLASGSVAPEQNADAQNPGAIRASASAPWTPR